METNATKLNVSLPKVKYMDMAMNALFTGQSFAFCLIEDLLDYGEMRLEELRGKLCATQIFIDTSDREVYLQWSDYKFRFSRNGGIDDNLVHSMEDVILASLSEYEEGINEVLSLKVPLSIPLNPNIHYHNSNEISFTILLPNSYTRNKL